MGDPLYPGNKNRMLYSAAARPLQGANLALHMGRWLSLVLGAVTIWLTYRTARLAFAPGSRLPWMAAALGGAHPAVYLHQRLFHQRQHGHRRVRGRDSIGWRGCWYVSAAPPSPFGNG